MERRRAGRSASVISPSGVYLNRVVSPAGLVMPARWPAPSRANVVRWPSGPTIATGAAGVALDRRDAAVAVGDLRQAPGWVVRECVDHGAGQRVQREQVAAGEVELVQLSAIFRGNDSVALPGDLPLFQHAGHSDARRPRYTCCHPAATRRSQDHTATPRGRAAVADRLNNAVARDCRDEAIRPHNPYAVIILVGDIQAAVQPDSDPVGLV